ncbi:unnamed protein product [Paramecium pentaurelia]|uniref:Uncharacterized protein n=1 Tax=Paramecium pentaurelia TaxID=43138 RepID=A0A8S1V9A7_9CILI|nr:unnamed protein product [Paramecium pentaurelia]
MRGEVITNVIVISFKQIQHDNIVKPLYLKKFQIEKSTSIYMTVWEQLLSSEMSSRLILLVWYLLNIKR